ncbi:DUF1993 domain-containing protein [Chitinibacteraceae bacterium HSL-7]
MFSYFDLTVPVFQRALHQLDHLLDCGAEWAAEHKVSDETMLGLRLAPDMHPFARQVQIACDTAKFAVARLSGTEAPRHPDNEASFAALRTRIAETQAFIASVEASAFADADTRTIELSFIPVPMSAQAYLQGFVLPNFYFHLTTAYALLRSNGVAIGKADFLGRP